MKHFRKILAGVLHFFLLDSLKKVTLFPLCRPEKRENRAYVKKKLIVVNS